MVHQGVVAVQVGHHGLLGGPCEFEGFFDFLRRQEIGDEIFPSYAGAVEGSSIFTGRDFECSLILGLTEMVDFNPLDGALGVRIDMDRHEEIRILPVGKLCPVFQLNELVPLTRHEDADSRLLA